MSNRTQFLKMLSDAELKLFDMVVVKDISRFARNTVDFLNAIRGLKSLGIEVKFLSNNQTILGDSEFILTIFSAMAQEESANLSKRIKFGKKINAKKGRVPLKIYGYDRINNFELIPNEQEAIIVNKIFNLYIEGHGSHKICRVLEDENIPTKLGSKSWSSRTIRRILINPIYIGHFINNKGEIKDYLTGKRIAIPENQHIHHERPEFRIISDELFNLAQEKMNSNRNTYKNEYVHMTGRESNRHIFSTLIRCEHCGYAYSRRCYNNKRVYWMCTGLNIKGSKFCDNNFYVEEPELIEYIKNYFTDLIKDKNTFFEKIIIGYNKAFKDKTENFDLTNLVKQTKKYTLEKEKFKEMYINNIIDIEELKEKTNDLNNKITESEKSVLKYQLLLNQKELLHDEIEQLYIEITNLLSVEKWSNIALKRIIDRIVVNKNGETVMELKQFSI